MKLFIYIAAFFMPTLSFGQDWKKYCVTYAGDTLRPGDSIRVVEKSPMKLLEYMRPHFNYTDDIWWEYRDHITFFVGGTHEISRLTRVHLNYRKKDWVPIAVLIDRYPCTGISKGVEFTLELDKALKAGAVEVVHKSKATYKPSNARTSN